MLTRTRPIAMVDPFSRMTRDLDRLFGTLGGSALQPSNSNGNSSRFAAPMNVWETEDAFHVETELPGLPMESIDVTATTDSLTIRGERTEQARDNATTHVRERRAGEFERALTLPGEINVDAVEARLEHGVLHVTLPKSDAGRRSRKIQIFSGNGEQTPPTDS